MSRSRATSDACINVEGTIILHKYPDPRPCRNTMSDVNTMSSPCMPMPTYSRQAERGNFKHYMVNHYVHDSRTIHTRKRTHNTCTQHTREQAHTDKCIAQQMEATSNQHGSSAIQLFHLVSTVNRFIMSHASVTFSSYIFILQQCLPLKYSLFKDV